jgi:hypothetical protein
MTGLRLYDDERIVGKMELNNLHVMIRSCRSWKQDITQIYVTRNQEDTNSLPLKTR